MSRINRSILRIEVLLEKNLERRTQITQRPKGLDEDLRDDEGMLDKLRSMLIIGEHSENS